MRSALLWLVAAAGCDPTFDPDPPSRLPWTAHAISASADHTLVVTGAGAVESDGVPVSRPTDDGGVEIPLMLPPASAVAVGKDHACAITAGGLPYCWGDHKDGALGSSRACTPQPNGGPPKCILDAEPMSALPPIRSIAAGDEFTCGIAFDQRVYCWGRFGRWLGGSWVPPSAPPTPVLLGGEPLLATRLIGSATTMCAIDEAANAWCWGDAFGIEPAHLGNGVIDLAIGVRHACAITAAGLSCWGDNTNGQCGDLEAARTCGDDCVVGETHLDLPVTRVVVGERHTCALTTYRDVVCWGSNEVGQLGRADAFLLGDVGFVVANAVELAAGYSHTCAVTADGTGWCWGDHLSPL